MKSDDKNKSGVNLEKINVKLNNAKKMVMFGIGVQFNDCYKQIVLSCRREPDYVCDNDSGKWGKYYFGKKCISPEELSKLGTDTVVVITVRRYEQIYKQLSELGLKEIFVAVFDRGYDIVASINELNFENLTSTDEKFISPVKGKWTLVTGASRGIGRQIALKMAELGSNIIAHSRKLEHTKELVEIGNTLGVQVIPIAAELENINEVELMISELTDKFPPVDIVFNNAAISRPNTWNHFTSKDFSDHYTVNTIAPILISSSLIPQMKKRGYGRIINVSSTIQKRPDELAYACSKAALSKFVFDLAPGLEGTGVSISLTCPGHVKSDMGGETAPHSVESVIPGVLLGALMEENVNGRWFIAHDYSGLNITDAINKAKFYYNLGV